MKMRMVRSGLITALIGSGVLVLHPHQSVYGLPPVRPQTISQQSTADDFFNRALEEYEKGDFTGAIADYTKAIAINPEYAAAYSSRGATKNDLKDYPEAIADYPKAIAISSKLAEAHYNRGIVYATTGNSQQSKQDLRTAAQLFRRQGRMADYEKAMQLLQRP